MAFDQSWTQFISYLDIIAARQDWRGEQARSLKLVLAKVCELEFDMTQPVDLTALYDIISSPAVVAAVVASLTHVAEDEAALRAAVAAVVEP
jgi:hypothetical protein